MSKVVKIEDVLKVINNGFVSRSDMPKLINQLNDVSLLTEELTLLSDERQRQVDKYGYTDEHILASTEDYGDGELAMAAAAYLCSDRWTTKDHGYLPQILFPWADEYFKPSPDDRIKELTKAGAMIIAEIRRLKSLPKAPHQ